MLDVMSELISEVVFFSIGDSNDISTFSGVPFFFSRELERKGIVVNRVDLSPSPFVSRWYNRIVKLQSAEIHTQSAHFTSSFSNTGPSLQMRLFPYNVSHVHPIHAPNPHPIRASKLI